MGNDDAVIEAEYEPVGGSGTTALVRAGEIRALLADDPAITDLGAVDTFLGGLKWLANLADQLRNGFGIPFAIDTLRHGLHFALPQQAERTRRAVFLMAEQQEELHSRIEQLEDVQKAMAADLVDLALRRERDEPVPGKAGCYVTLFIQAIREGRQLTGLEFRAMNTLAMMDERHMAMIRTVIGPAEDVLGPLGRRGQPTTEFQILTFRLSDQSVAREKVNDLTNSWGIFSVVAEDQGMGAESQWKQLDKRLTQVGRVIRDSIEANDERVGVERE